MTEHPPNQLAYFDNVPLIDQDKYSSPISLHYTSIVNKQCSSFVNPNNSKTFFTTFPNPKSLE
ncbi:hypothetical protein FRB98_005800, partial [Tulasnella sp. 332]